MTSVEMPRFAAAMAMPAAHVVFPPPPLPPTK